MKLLSTATIALTAMATIPAANANLGSFGQSTSVPEISALEGTAAVAALAAIVLIAWERRCRAS